MSSEFELIERIKARLSRPDSDVLVGPGDDAAVVEANGVIVTSVDAFVENVHFRTSGCSFRDIGHKCVAGTLSDIAAMGARAGELYIAVALTPRIEEQQALDLIDGAESLAGRFDVNICGGDIVVGEELMLALTVIGHADSRQQLVLRSTAQSGDLVGVSGELGGAAAGLALFDREADQPQGEVAERLLERYLRPLPQLEAGRALAGAGVSAMIDVSDGIASDAQRLAEASEIGVEIDLQRLPLQEGVAELAAASGRDPLELAATGGEDYELLFCCPPSLRDRAEAAAAAASTTATWIGRVTEGPGVRLLDADGAVRNLKGWDHLLQEEETVRPRRGQASR